MQVHKSLFPFPEILEKSMCSSKRSICWAPLQENMPWSASDTLTPKFVFIAGRNLSSKFCFRFFKEMGVILSSVVECSFPCGDGFKKNFQILIVLLLAMESNILFSFLVYLSLAPWLSSMTDCPGIIRFRSSPKFEAKLLYINTIDSLILLNSLFILLTPLPSPHENIMGRVNIFQLLVYLSQQP